MSTMISNPTWILVGWRPLLMINCVADADSIDKGVLQTPTNRVPTVKLNFHALYCRYVRIRPCLVFVVPSLRDVSIPSDFSQFTSCTYAHILMWNLGLANRKGHLGWVSTHLLQRGSDSPYPAPVVFQWQSSVPGTQTPVYTGMTLEKCLCASSGFPVVFQCVPIMQINTGSPLEHHWVIASASVVPVASQCTCGSSCLPVCSNYTN